MDDPPLIVVEIQPEAQSLVERVVKTKVRQYGGPLYGSPLFPISKKKCRPAFNTGVGGVKGVGV